MKIRMANENDLQKCVDELVTGIHEFPEFKADGVVVTRLHYDQLVKLCNERGVIVVAEENDKVIGSIMGIVNTNIVNGLNDLITVINWVHPSRRHSSAFYRMHKLYKEEYTKLKRQHKIDRVLMANLPKRTNVNFEKLGFKPIETTYEWR